MHVRRAHTGENGVRAAVCTREITSTVVSVDHDVPFIQAPINDLQMYLTSLKAVLWFTDLHSTASIPRVFLFADRTNIVFQNVDIRDLSWILIVYLVRGLLGIKSEIKTEIEIAGLKVKMIFL